MIQWFTLTVSVTQGIKIGHDRSPQGFGQQSFRHEPETPYVSSMRAKAEDLRIPITPAKFIVYV